VCSAGGTRCPARACSRQHASRPARARARKPSRRRAAAACGQRALRRGWRAVQQLRRRTVDLAHVAAALHADAHVHASEASAAQQQHRLENLEAQNLRLNQLQRDACAAFTARVARSASAPVRPEPARGARVAPATGRRRSPARRTACKGLARDAATRRRRAQPGHAPLTLIMPLPRLQCDTATAFFCGHERHGQQAAPVSGRPALRACSPNPKTLHAKAGARRSGHASSSAAQLARRRRATQRPASGRRRRAPCVQRTAPPANTRERRRGAVACTQRAAVSRRREQRSACASVHAQRQRAAGAPPWRHAPCTSRQRALKESCRARSRLEQCLEAGGAHPHARIPRTIERTDAAHGYGSALAITRACVSARTPCAGAPTAQQKHPSRMHALTRQPAPPPSQRPHPPPPLVPQRAAHQQQQAQQRPQRLRPAAQALRAAARQRRRRQRAQQAAPRMLCWWRR
jgi:hypothetical protein